MLYVDPTSKIPWHVCLFLKMNGFHWDLFRRRKKLILRHRRSGTKYLVIMKSAGVGPSMFCNCQSISNCSVFGDILFNILPSSFTNFTKPKTFMNKQTDYSGRLTKKKNIFTCSKLLEAYGMSLLPLMDLGSSI